MIRFKVPAGIGDFSWIWQKLAPLGKEFEFSIQGNDPRRTAPFLEILPGVRSLGYGKFAYEWVLEKGLKPGTDLANLPEGEYGLSFNSWLEKGNRIELWNSGETDYHYRMETTLEHKEQALATLAPFRGRVIVGVYMSAKGPNFHWKHWNPATEWFEFLSGVEKEIPEAAFVFIGADWDRMLFAEFAAGMLKSPVANTIGQTHIGAVVEILKGLDYFFAFPSGLGVIADVLNTPNLMWFPRHLEKIRYTFCDPANSEGLTLHRPFEAPEISLREWKRVGLPEIKKRYGVKQCA